MKIKKVISTILASILSITTLGSIAPAHAEGNKNISFKTDAKPFVPRNRSTNTPGKTSQSPGTTPSMTTLASTEAQPSTSMWLHRTTSGSSTGSSPRSPDDMWSSGTTISQRDTEYILKALKGLFTRTGLEIEIPGDTYSTINSVFLYTVLYELYNLFSNPEYEAIKQRCIEWLTSGSFGGKLVIDVSTTPTSPRDRFRRNTELDAFLKTNMYGSTTMLDLKSPTYSFTIFLSSVFFGKYGEHGERLESEIIDKVRKKIEADNPYLRDTKALQKTHYAPFTYCAHELIGCIIYHAYCNHIYRTTYPNHFIGSQEHLKKNVLMNPDFNDDLQRMRPDHKRGFTWGSYFPKEDVPRTKWGRSLLHYHKQFDGIGPEIESYCEDALKENLGPWWGEPDKPFYTWYANYKIAPPTLKSTDPTAMINILFMK